MRKILTLTTSAICLFAATTSYALSATQTVKKEVTRVLENGQTVTEQVDATLVTPGEKVIYMFDIYNDETEAVNDLVLAMPVPKEIQFIEGSADREGSSVTYSVDDGKSFHERDDLNVRENSGLNRAATTDDITHVRWNISGPIAVGEGDQVLFKGRLR
ncbi:MAG: hypothetical protein ABJG88_06480 [Litorimonas sp.]